MSSMSIRNRRNLRHAWAAAFAVLLLLMLMTGPPAPAQTSQQMMNVQGRLFDNAGNPLTGNQNITFRIYDGVTTPPGNLLFAEGPIVVATNNGYYNYNLGSNTGGGIPANVFSNANSWLEIQIAAEILTPRTRIVSSAYAFNADMVDGQHGAYYTNASNLNAGTVGTTFGGTGQNWSATAAGNVPYFTGAGALGLSGAPAGAGQYLRSTSGTAMAWSNIQAADIPAGSALYLARNAADTSTAAAAAAYLYQFTNSSVAATGGLSVTSAAGNGLYATSAGQYGVYGRSTQNAATATGIYGRAEPAGLFDAIGVMGYCKPQDHYGYGGWFEGGWMGVYGVSNGLGGVGTNYMGAQLNAFNVGALGNAYGVFCTASGGTGGNRIALHADGSGAGGTTAYGIEALASGTGTTNYAVYANASGAATTNYGIFARATAAGTNWAGYFEGNVGLGGTVAAPELRLFEPSGSGTQYTAFRAQAQAGNLTYTLPAADGTANQVLATNGGGSLSWISNPAGGAPVGAQYVTMALDATLTSERVLTAGNGLSLTDAGANGNATLALNSLTANWTQSGAFDVVLNNAASELRILESAGATFYGTFDVGDLSGDQTYTFSTGGTVWTSGNDGTTSTLDADLLDGQDSTAFAPATGSNNYVQLQAGWPGAQQTGNANISATLGANEIRIGSQGGDATRNIYFYEGGSATGRYFQWNDADTYFRMNDCLKLMGGLTSDLRITGDAIYLRNDGGDVSQYLYFYEGGSATGASLQWDDGNSRFNFSTTLNINGALQTNGTERMSAAGTISNATWNGNTIAVGYGGIGTTTLTANGVLYGNAAAAIQATAVGANETVLTGTGAAPAFSNDPILSGLRTTGIGIRLAPWGTNSGETGEVRFRELVANGVNYVGFKAPDSINADLTWALPATDGTNGQVLSTNGTGTLSWTSNPVGGAPSGAQYVTLALDGTLTAERVLTAGSGIGITDGGANGNVTLALGSLTANWSQSNAFDIVLNNANSELILLESVGGTFYGSIDVGDLSSDQTYTFTTGGTVMTSGNIGATAFIQNGNSFGGLATCGTNDANALAFETNNTEWVRITAAGNVGIGTTNPTQRFYVEGNTTINNGAVVISGGIDMQITGSSQLEGYGGTAASPGFSFFGDDNTGMYRVGADSVGFSMGGTNAMTISAARQVGIGIAPSYLLDLSDTTANGRAVNALFSGAVNGYSAYFSNTATGAGGKYGAYASATGGNGTNYGVYADASGAGVNWAGYFAGNVGLGGTAAAPQLRLYEPNGSGGNYTAFVAQAQVGDVTYTLPVNAGTPGQVLSTDGGGALSWATATATPAGANGDVQFNSGGSFGADNLNFFWDDGNNRLGLGTNAPSYRLHVVGDGIYCDNFISGTRYPATNAGTVAAASFAWAADDDTGMYLPAANNLGFTTNGAERIRIDGNGNVGIGTNAPAAPLEIKNNVGAPGAKILLTSNINTSINSDLELVLSGGEGPYGANWKNIIFKTNSTEKARIDNNGSLGIGDASPVSMLTVGNGDLFQVNSSGNLVAINNVAYSWPGGQGAANTFLKNDGSGGLTWAAGAAGTPGGANGAVQFNSAGSFGGDAGNFYWDNTNKYLGIGTGATASSVLHVKGGLDPLVLIDATGGLGMLKWAANGAGRWGWCLNDPDFTLWHYPAPTQSYITFSAAAPGHIFLVPVSGNVGIGTTTPGGGAGSSILSIKNTGVAPNSAAAMSHIYTVAGEGWWMDDQGNTTQQTPHDPETGEWIFFSKNVKTGRVVRINMEQLVKEVERLSGKQFMTETCEQRED